MVSALKSLEDIYLKKKTNDNFLSEFRAVKSRLSLGNAAENRVKAPLRKDYEVIRGRVPVSVINWPRELQNVGQTQSKDPSWAYRADSVSLCLPTWWAGTISREDWLHGERALGADMRGHGGRERAPSPWPCLHAVR